MSIWNGVDRKTFESITWELNTIAPSQRPFALTSAKGSRLDEASSGRSREYTLPKGVEKQVCDDIAFLAAWDSTPECVTAATLQEATNADGITVNLAANEGISPHVAGTICEMFRLLEACAQREGRKDCASQCLDTILQLHRYRIRQRLGLIAVSDRERRTRQDFVSVSDRLRMMLEDVPKSGDSVMRASLVLEIRTLIAAIDELENSNPSDLSYIRGVVDAASRTAKRNESFTKKLQQAGYGEYAQRKEIRQLKGLANYKHCCDYLCRTARSYRTIFGSMKLNTIPAYAVETWPPKSEKKHFVHAEIQLLLYHEMSSGGGRAPRRIGVSKRACFLCYCFIRRYGTYITPETHGQVHPQWTIPDRNDYSKRLRNRLQDTLLKTRKDAKSALTVAKAGAKRHAPELQSPDRSVIFSLKTASASTLRPMSKLDSAVASMKDMPCTANSQQITPESGTSSGAVSKSSGSIGRVCHVSATSQEHCETVGLKPTRPSIVEIDWLTLFVPYDRPADEGSHGATCNVSRIVDISACPSAQVIQISDFEVGKTLRLSETATGEAEVVFVYEDRKSIGVRLTPRLQT